MADQKVVVVIGASADRSKFSNKAIRSYVNQGWRVIPVNPKGGEIEGLPVSTSVADITDHVDRVTLYLPPALGLGIVGDVASVKPDEFYVNPGAESDELVEAARSHGLDPILACSIVEIGASPADYD
ncbi:MAG: CoA-binding protein [Phycisphaerae bacterium]